MITPGLQQIIAMGMRVHPLRPSTKVPLLEEWPRRASSDPAQVEQWLADFPGCNFGVACGPTSKTWVLDVDGPEGLASFKELCRRYGKENFVTFTVRTPHGWHLYFIWRDDFPVANSVEAVAPGIDTRGANGYVVAPDSAADGRLYSIMRDAPIAECFFYELFNQPHPARQIDDPDVLIIPDGQRNVILTSLAGSMRAKGFTQAAIEAALLAQNEARCQPPLPESEVLRISASIGNKPAGPTVVLTEPEVEELFTTAAESCSQEADETAWRVWELWAQASIVAVSAKVKTGKSTLVLDITRSILAGEPWCGRPTAQCPIVFLTEQSRASFNEQLAAAGLQDSRDLHVLYRPETVKLAWPVVAQLAVEKCQAVGAGVLVVDTLTRWANQAGDAENDAGIVGAMTPLEPAMAANVTIVLVFHSPKSATEVEDSIRGSSALAGAVDHIFRLKRPEGNHRGGMVRLLDSIGRFHNIPEDLVLELKGGRYTSLDVSSKDAIELAAAQAAIRKLLPTTPDDAMTVKELVERGRGSRRTIGRALVGMVGVLVTGQGTKGSPRRYYRQEMMGKANDGRTPENSLPIISAPSDADNKNTCADDGQTRDKKHLYIGATGEGNKVARSTRLVRSASSTCQSGNTCVLKTEFAHNSAAAGVARSGWSPGTPLPPEFSDDDNRDADSERGI